MATQLDDHYATRNYVSYKRPLETVSLQLAQRLALPATSVCVFGLGRVSRPAPDASGVFGSALPEAGGENSTAQTGAEAQLTVSRSHADGALLRQRETH